MKQIKALQVLNWTQDPKVAKTIEVLVVLKSVTLSRIDDEVIEINKKGEDQATFKTRYTATCIFEVYPDNESFQRRSLPIEVFREKFDLPEQINNVEDYILQELQIQETFTQQDFKTSYLTVITAN